jgi:hypothetical protein
MSLLKLNPVEPPWYGPVCPVVWEGWCREASPYPDQLHFEQLPSAGELCNTIDSRIPADGYFDDVHGSAAYKRHLTYYFAEQIRAELAQPGDGA